MAPVLATASPTLSNSGNVREFGVGMLGAAFARRHAADDLGAVGAGLLRVEGALAARNALANDLGILVDKNRHSNPA